MAKITKDNVLIREVFDEAVSGVLAQKNALMGSMLAATGAAVIAGDMPETKSGVGSTINIPYFGVIGDFEDVSVDGTALTPKAFGQTQEQATVVHSGLAFEVSRWARSSVGRDIHDEGADQVKVALTRKMDKYVIDAACAAGGLVLDKYNAGTPRTIDYDLVVDGRMLWADEQDDIVAMMVHSKAYADLLKLKDGDGKPLVTLGDVSKGEFTRFCGIPVGVSDRLPITATMGSVTSGGTSPPALTLGGTPNALHNLKIVCTVGGAHTTAKFKFSTDGGNNYSAELTTLGVGVALGLTDTNKDSLVGLNGATGLTAAFAAGTFNVDNTWTAAASGKLTSLILKSQSLAFWFNRQALALQTDKDILADTDVAAMHLYAVAHRYKRRRGGYRPGVVVLRHN